MKTDGVVQKRKRQGKGERMKKLKVRKKKIVAISCRKEKGKIIAPFGFPTIKSNKAFFFTNFGTKKEIFRVLNNVYSLPKKNIVRDWTLRFF